MKIGESGKAKDQAAQGLAGLPYRIGSNRIFTYSGKFSML
jgi:hypothetical protein